MTTKNKKFVVTDKQKATLLDRNTVFLERCRRGILNPDHALEGLQMLNDGKRLKEFTITDLIEEWEQFYNDIFNIYITFTGYILPATRKGFNRPLIMAQSITASKLVAKCEELFSCKKWTNDDFDKIVVSDRTAQDASYGIWIRDRQIADTELTGYSCNYLTRLSTLGITLEERLLYELKYFTETKEHLDIGRRTLCSGSIYESILTVPTVYCKNNILHISKGHLPSIPRQDTSAREVIAK
ncbi:hypothetical protein MYX06_00875 [Patescibacteria group bacterium AH-259-L05]|nr:hypothetical protein [Patescibacteria group bacterium AH-259-L05]